MEQRRIARQQPLPLAEADVLNKLWDEELYTRIRALYDAGWTLDAIGQAFSPPRRRSTVRYWANRTIHGEYPQISSDIPQPRLKPRGYVSRRPKSPGIPPTELMQIKALAPLARRYRAKMSPASSEAMANLSLTEICMSLVESNVTVKELAEAAGVTYRAMARRLGR
jgi:hypothetical protein